MKRYGCAAVLCAILAGDVALANAPGDAALARQLIEGDASERLAALGVVGPHLGNNPDVLLPAMMACAWQSEARLSATAIATIGQQLIWVDGPQNQQAIEFALAMSYDDDPDILHACIYFCLSTVRRKSPELIDRLIELACDHESLYRRELHRVAWGLRGQKTLAAERIQAYLDRQDDGAKHAPAVATELYYRVTGDVPKRCERFSGPAAYAVIVKLDDPLRPKSRDEITAALGDALDDETAGFDMRPCFQDDEAFAVVFVNGAGPYVRLLKVIDSTPGLQKAGEETMLTPESRDKIEAAVNAIPAAEPR